MPGRKPKHDFPRDQVAGRSAPSLDSSKSSSQGTESGGYVQASLFVDGKPSFCHAAIAQGDRVAPAPVSGAKWLESALRLTTVRELSSNAKLHLIVLWLEVGNGEFKEDVAVGRVRAVAGGSARTVQRSFKLLQARGLIQIGHAESQQVQAATYRLVDLCDAAEPSTTRKSVEPRSVAFSRNPPADRQLDCLPDQTASNSCRESLAAPALRNLAASPLSATTKIPAGSPDSGPDEPDSSRDQAPESNAAQGPQTIGAVLEEMVAPARGSLLKRRETRNGNSLRDLLYQKELLEDPTRDIQRQPHAVLAENLSESIHAEYRRKLAVTMQRIRDVVRDPRLNDAPCRKVAQAILDERIEWHEIERIVATANDKVRSGESPAVWVYFVGAMRKIFRDLKIEWAPRRNSLANRPRNDNSRASHPRERRA